MKSPSKSPPEGDPLHHVEHVRVLLRQVVDHLRKDIGVITEPKAQALFETSAEVLIGLTKAFDDHQKQIEPAWRIESAVAQSSRS